MKAYYMHLMDGRPAHFEGRGKTHARLVYSGKSCLKLAKSLKQIRAEQAVSKKFYGGSGSPDVSEYDYVRIPCYALNGVAK